MTANRQSPRRGIMAALIVGGVLLLTAGGSVALQRIIVAEPSDPAGSDAVDAAPVDETARAAPPATTEAHQPKVELAAAVAAAAVSIDDPTGESGFAWADIRSAAVTAEPDGTITARMVLAQWTDPATDDWQFGATEASWSFDTDADGGVDQRVQVGIDGSELRGTVAESDGSVRCVGEATSSGTTASYSVTFSAACIGNPESFRFRSNFEYDDVTFDLQDDDEAPDTGWSATVSNPAFVAPIVTVDPARLFDSRSGVGRRAAGSVTEVVVAGRGGVPADARAALLNVTAVGPNTAGFATVFPCGQPRPDASNLNYQPGRDIPNAVLAKLGADGKVCVFTYADLHLIVDVNGFVPALSDVVALQPGRLFDSRATAGRRPAGSITEVAVTDRFGVPADAAGVLLNVTAVGPNAAGFATVFPCGQPRPDASNLNYQPGQDIPNAVLAKVGTNGNVCIYTYADTHLIVDVNGYVPSTSTVTSLRPGRLFDSRATAGRRPAGSITEVAVTDRFGVPADAAGVLLNVTAVGPNAAGFATVFPCGQPRPDASNLNYQPGQDIPNAVLAKVGTNGNVCIYTYADTHLIVDVNGYVP